VAQDEGPEFKHQYPKKKKTVKKKRGGVNMIKVHYMLAWKHHNEKITGLEV
jgi:hypothetical protein